MNKQLAFYEQGSLSIIDVLSNTTGRGQYSNETIEDIRKRYPNAEIVPFDYAIEQIDEAVKEKYQLLKPIEITDEIFNEMLECLPPVNWVMDGVTASFQMSEREFGNITACYVNKGSKYYKVMARTSIKHEQLIAVCP